MNTDAARYARITHRLASGVASGDDASSRALASLLEQRVVESIAIECAPYVTSDVPSERMLQAAAALRERGISVRVEAGNVIQDRCFCDSDGCRHGTMLIERLIAVAASIGAVDAVRYT
jgi:hypothetical protein